MKWALKFSTKGKGAGGGPDAGKPYNQQPNSFRNGGAGGGAGDTAAARDGGFRSGSDGEGGPLGGEYYEDGDGLEPGQERDTPILTPPDAVNGGGGRGAEGGGPDSQHQQRGEKDQYQALPADGEGSSATYEGEDNNIGGSSAPHFTVEDSESRQQRREGEGEEMDYEDSRHQQQGVFDEDGDSQADSLQASKTARMKSFADDPEAHELEDNAEWDGEGTKSGGFEWSHGPLAGSLACQGRLLRTTENVFCLGVWVNLLLYRIIDGGFPSSRFFFQVKNRTVRVCVCFVMDTRTKKFDLFFGASPHWTAAVATLLSRASWACFFVAQCSVLLSQPDGHAPLVPTRLGLLLGLVFRLFSRHSMTR